MSAGLPAQGEPPSAEQQPPARSDVAHWAKVDGARLAVGTGADAAINGWGIAGRRVTGPMQGFGRLWQRTYTLPIGSVATPQEAIALWRSHFGEFWPNGNRFYGAIEGINPGDVAPISVNTGAGLKLTTGVLVIYADDESFSFMTPEGHMFAGMITFSAHETPQASGFSDPAAGSSDPVRDTTLQVQVLIRPNDPIWDLGMPVMKFMEDRFWAATMRNLAHRLGSQAKDVDVVSVIVDRKRLWHNAKNVRYNAAVRSTIHLVGTPFRALARLVRHR